MTILFSLEPCLNHIPDLFIKDLLNLLRNTCCSIFSYVLVPYDKKGFNTNI